MKDMPDILARICAAKQEEVAELKSWDADRFRRQAGRQTAPRGFRKALAEGEGVGLIAEIKKASPSAGIIREDFDPERIADYYHRGGARCISVLTDGRFFQGSPDYLPLVRNCVPLPLLRKDFILDEIQVHQARALGADACLLIVAALEQANLQHLMAVCRETGMDALVEVHDRAEMDAAVAAGADLIGVNNRDLRTFEVSLEVTERLAPLAPPDALIVAESGIRTRADVERLRDVGAKGILVGETLMRADDVEAATRELASV